MLKRKSKMTDVQDSIRERARRMVRGAVLAKGTYGFIRVGKPTLLDPKDDKPRTITVDVAPLKDVSDKNTVAHDFKRTLWVKLIGVEGYEPLGNAATNDINTLAALVPGRIDPLTKQGKDWYFRGNVVKGRAYEEAQTERAIQAMEVAQELFEKPDLISEDTFFYGTIKLGKEPGQAFLNNLTTEEPESVDVPEEASSAN
jgi:hypothetical protein